MDFEMQVDAQEFAKTTERQALSDWFLETFKRYCGYLVQWECWEKKVTLTEIVMESYVALFVGHDNSLGRTIHCPDWQSAVTACCQLATEQREPLPDADIKALDENGSLEIDTGWLHIGGLEDFE